MAETDPLSEMSLFEKKSEDDEPNLKYSNVPGLGDFFKTATR
jgi:hypothetical protein